MVTYAIVFVVFIVGTTALLSWPLGRYMRWAMDPDATDTGAAGRFTHAFQRVGGPITRVAQDWKRYMISLLIFNVIMFVVSYGLMALQQYLPLNPDGKGALSGDLIFNTAASFTSNTNLQHYSGEVSMSYLSQLGALMWLQFVSAATGIAALAALARGLAGRKDLGNFFVDVQRASLLVLLPIALVVATLMLIGGMPMTFQGSAVATTLEGAQQIIARGPVAAFLTIKQLGTNGGGWFGPNSTHPFENPTFWTNALSMICIILIPMACVWMFGRIVGRMRHAAVVFAVMLALVLTRIVFAIWFETAPTRGLRSAADRAERRQSGGQGAALWRHVRTDLGGDHHLDQQRLGRRHARQPQSPDRAHADDRHVAERGFWRRRRRHGQYVPLHHRRRVHRRHDGWPYARISRLAGGIARGQIRHPRAPGARLLHPRGHRDLCGDPLGHRDPQQYRPAWVQRDALRVQLVQCQQRIWLRGSRRQYRAVERLDRHRHAARPLHSRSSCRWRSSARL